MRELLSRRNVVIAAGSAGVLLLGWALFAPESDEEQIRALLERLAREIAVEGETNILFRTARLNKAFEEIFTEDVSVSIPELTSLARGRGELARVAARAGSHFQNAEVSVKSVDVSFGPTPAHGKAACVAVLSSTDGSRARRDERLVDFTLLKRDGDWRIDGIIVGERPE